MDFEWDNAKAKANRQKHGVSFEAAREVFGDPSTLTGPDVAHSSNEDRERTIGHDSRGRLLVVISNRRAEVTRIISARKATAFERRAYEAKIKEERFGED